MRIVFLGNNLMGWQVLDWLRARGEDIAAVVVHPKAKQKYGQEILAAANVESSSVFDGSRLREAEMIERLGQIDAEIAVSILFDYVLKPEFLDLFPMGAINLHPSYLPFNRGQYPNVWSIVEQTPSGVTLHYIDEQIDSGDIIAQQKVPVASSDTGQSLYQKLERAGVQLFQNTWPLIRASRSPRKRQQGEGTYHRTCDVERIDHIKLDEKYTARELINILRARTFPPYSGAWFEEDGRRVYLRLELIEEDAV